MFIKNLVKNIILMISLNRNKERGIKILFWNNQK